MKFLSQLCSFYISSLQEFVSVRYMGSNFYNVLIVIDIKNNSGLKVES